MLINYWIATILFAFTSLIIANSIFVVKIKNSNAARILSALSIIIAVLSFSYAMELIGSSFDSMKSFYMIRSFAIPLLAPIFFLLSLVIAKNEKLTKLSISFLVFIIPLITIIFSLTSAGHTFYFYNFSVVNNKYFDILQKDVGFWYYVSNIYNLILYVLSIVILIKMFLRNKNNRKLSIVLICAICMPMTSDIIDFIGLSPYHVSMLPIALALSTVFFLLGTIRYRIFHPVPFAHSKVFEWSTNGILVLDPNMNLLDFNPTIAKLFPHISRGSIGRNISNLFASGDEIKESILSKTEYSTVIKSDDKSYNFKMVCSSLQGKNNIMLGYMVTFTDITTLVKTMKELTELATIDPLTGAQTRRHFSTLAQIEFLRSKRHNHSLSFIMLDIDFFKNINDKFGHRAGDEMLKYICSLCYKNIRTIDLLGRFGGEEFMILLPETEIEGAVVVAKRIKEVLESSTMIFEGKEMNVTASFGVTGVDCIKDEDLDIFLKYADRALYMAKRKGRNKVQVMYLPKIAK